MKILKVWFNSWRWNTSTPKPRPGHLLYRCEICTARIRIKTKDIDTEIHHSLAFAPQIPHDCDADSIGIATLIGALASL